MNSRTAACQITEALCCVILPVRIVISLPRLCTTMCTQIPDLILVQCWHKAGQRVRLTLWDCKTQKYEFFKFFFSQLDWNFRPFSMKETETKSGFGSFRNRMTEIGHQWGAGAAHTGKKKRVRWRQHIEKKKWETKQGMWTKEKLVDDWATAASSFGLGGLQSGHITNPCGSLSLFPLIQTQKNFCTFHEGKQEGGVAQQQNPWHMFGCPPIVFLFLFLFEAKRR